MAPRSLPLARGASVRRACAGACFLALLAGCGGGGATTYAGGPKGVLFGMVTRGPTMPVCRKGTPCSEPASGAKLLFLQDRHVVATAVVGKDGSYSKVLPFGTYTVALAEPPSIGRGIEPNTVSAAAGPARKVDFQIDTGIR